MNPKCLNPKCENELSAFRRGTRKFCSDACRQAYFRQQHQSDQGAALLTELEELRTKVQNQAREIADQAARIAQLKRILDIEKRYLEDTTPRTFKAWLRKQPQTELSKKLLTDQLIPVRGSRALYEAHLRRMQYSEYEIARFKDLWKLMLLSQA